MPLSHLKRTHGQSQLHPQDLQWRNFGNSLLNTSNRSPEGTAGVVIKFIVPGSPLEQAKVPVGAILTSIDSKMIRTRDEYVDAIRQHEPGDVLALKIRAPNNETEQEFKFKLGSLQ